MAAGAVNRFAYVFGHNHLVCESLTKLLLCQASSIFLCPELAVDFNSAVQAKAFARHFAVLAAVCVIYAEVVDLRHGPSFMPRVCGGLTDDSHAKAFTRTFSGATRGIEPVNYMASPYLNSLGSFEFRFGVWFLPWIATSHVLRC
jgi:hypothetical protein